MNEIRKRTAERRKRRSRLAVSASGIMSLVLLVGIGILMEGTGTPGTLQARGGYSSLLLQTGADAYIVVGIAAFAAGVTVTLVCCRVRQQHRGNGGHREEEPE